jgi:hypothetical protein
MKLLTSISRNHFLNYKPLQLCQEKLNGFSRWLYSALLHGLTISLQQINLHVHVDQVQPAIHAMAQRVNRRIFIGLGLIGVVAPVAGSFYTFLSHATVSEDWYYLNWFNLFLVLGPPLKNVFFAWGVFYLFPEGAKRAWIIALPMGEEIGKILWLISITNNEQFWSVAPWHVYVTGISLAVFLLTIAEFITFRYHHRQLKYKATVEGLYNIVDEESIPDSKFRSMFKTTMIAQKNFQKEY